MAVDKSFVVKNGLEVNSDLIVADASSKRVGIASTAPRSTLDVRGGIAATDINITGVATIATLKAAAGDVNLGNLGVTGFSTLGGVSVDQLTVTGFTTFADISYDEISGRNITLTGIATIPVFVGLTSFNDGVEVTGISTFTDIDTTNLNVSGVSTIATVDINAGDIEVSNVDTTDLNVTGVGTIDVGIIQNAQVVNLNATGVSTIASLSVTGSTFDTLTVNNFSNLSGITTIDDPILGKATVSGVVTAAQFIGAGQIGIGTSGGLVGYGVSFLEFRGPGFTTAQFNSAVGIVTLSFQGGGGSGGGSASIGVGSTPGDAFTGIITAGNLWYNTGLGRLFIYYQDDNSAQWVDAAPFNVGIITQLTSVSFSTGSVSAPALSFGNDTDTGFFAPADGSVAYSSNGVGIVTFNSTGVLATTYFGDGSNLTGIDATSIKDDGGNVKVQGNPNGIVITGIVTGSTANFTGVVTASAFSGDGSSLSNLPAGLGTALSSDTTSPLNKIYYTDQVLGVASTITIDPPSTAVVAYTQYAEVQVTGDADLIVGDGDEFVMDILGIGTTTVRDNLGGSGGRILADNYINASGTGAPTFGAGLNVTGVLTATSFDGAATGLSGSPDITVTNVTGVAATFSGNVTIGGTLTYQDVENIDSIGIITAQQGIQVLANGLDVTGFSTFNTGVDVTGVVSATSFYGDGSALTGIAGTADVSTSSLVVAGVSTLGNVGINTTSTPTNLYVSGNAASNIVALGNTDANTTLDFSTGNNFSLTLTGSIVLSNPTGVTTGQSGIVLISQDGTGSRTCGFGSHWDFPSSTAPTLSTGADALDALTYFVRSSTSIVTNSLIGIGTL